MNKIAGVFDSGVGGLTVVRTLLEHNIFDKIIYFGDTARVPYGNKDKNTIIRYSLEAVEFFENFDIDIIIVACNTVSVFALKQMQKSSKVPVIGVVEAGVDMASKKVISKTSKILTIGTKGTIQSKIYDTKLKLLGFTNTISIATPLFVPIVEQELENTPILQETMNYYFNGLENIEYVILGCTHFPIISKQIATYFDSATTIQSGEAIVETLKKKFKYKKAKNLSKIEFYASDAPAQLKIRAKSWLLEKYF
ncbi:MAG: glutamate racemase [Epsilonproteobacteria bacterium]|nr:MAG: glutamate racemase [Campylobacterota bacterium]